MSKLKLIKGGEKGKFKKVGEILTELKRVEHTLDDVGHYHFATLLAKEGASTKSQELLSKIDPNFFLNDVYKYLFEAMYCWSLYYAGRKSKELLDRANFYKDVQETIEIIAKYRFKGKRQFMVMRQNLENIKKYTKV